MLHLLHVQARKDLAFANLLVLLLSFILVVSLEELLVVSTHLQAYLPQPIRVCCIEHGYKLFNEKSDRMLLNGEAPGVSSTFLLAAIFRLGTVHEVVYRQTAWGRALHDVLLT